MRFVMDVKTEFLGELARFCRAVRRGKDIDAAIVAAEFEREFVDRIEKAESAARDLEDKNLLRKACG